MAIGAGKYDEMLTRALADAKAQSGILLIFDGEKGQGFSCTGPPEMLFKMPEILRIVAAMIEDDRRRITDRAKIN